MDILTLSRIQFGGTAAFHILWPLLSIGLALYMFILEALWLRTSDESYYRQLRFWTKIFVLTFAIGTASGIPLEFEFGTNWAAFSTAAGDFLGNILGFESTVAFALEAAFLGIFVFGWKRVHPYMHLFANGMVALGATLSAFWIMVANSWMQIPVGVAVKGTQIVVTDYLVAIFNQGSLVSFAHMEVACIETTLFFIMGLCAIVLLGRHDDARKRFFLQAFKIALIIAVGITPLQIYLGDLSGRSVAANQPEKLAAFEMQWNTNPPGTGAAWSLVAWPNAAGNGDAFDVAVPDALSLLTTHTLTGFVPGLNSFAKDDTPTKTEDVMTFYSFRLMVLIGVVMFLLMVAGVWYWRKGYLTQDKAHEHAIFWWLWVLAIPLGFIATEAGWMVREIGRQPWVVYHLMRTSEGLSQHLSSASVTTTTGLFAALYLAFIGLFIYFTARIMRAGPDLTSPVLTYARRTSP
jgi:cytochrome bd ubiquinol oxidase subunit I